MNDTNNYEVTYESNMRELLRLYDQAYYRFVYCPEHELKEAKQILDQLRNKFFNY
jgi:hypothetical protein